MPGLDAARDLVVLEHHVPIDVIEPPFPVRVSHPPRLVVSTQRAVCDRDAHETGVLPERADREVENADRECRRQEQLELGRLRVRLTGATDGPPTWAVAGGAALVDRDVDRVRLPDPHLRVRAMDDLRRTPKAGLPHGEAFRPEFLSGPRDELGPGRRNAHYTL